MDVTLKRVGERRSKCARCRRGREDNECANRQPGTSSPAAEHLLDPDIPCLQLPILCLRLWLRFHCRLKCPEAFANHQLILSLWSSVILSSAARRSFRSFSYLSQFLEYLMENGDLRAVVRYFLPFHNSNYTYHMRLYADRRDPPISPALHVSTLHRFGYKAGCGARN